MKIVEFSDYGSPDVLKVINKEKPKPKNDEVLVEVHATSVNDWDWSLVNGKPLIYRIMFGLFSPKIKTPGAEIAGAVAAVGEEVSNIQVGDRVFGDISTVGLGGFAEYVSVPESALYHMPKNLTFEEAASLPHASLLAWQAMMDVGGLKKGEKVLINGAGGGVGTLGLQIAKYYKCHVTGVDKDFKINPLKQLGFDEVIDYEQTDFTSTGEKYDLIIDAKTTRNSWQYLKALNPSGRYITVGGYLPKIFQIVFC